MRNEGDTDTNPSDESNNNINNDNTTTNNTNKYTPREKLLHLMSLLPNTLKDKENLVATIHKLGDRFSSFLGIPNNQEVNEHADIAKDEGEDIDEDEFVLVRSNEDITNEIKDEELAKALQKEEIEQLKRRQATQRQIVRQIERERTREQQEQQLRQLVGPREVPDLFTLLLFGLETQPPRQHIAQVQQLGEPSSAPLYMLNASQPPLQYPYHMHPAESEPVQQLSVVENLPSHVYNGRPLPVEKNSCTICLNEFKQGETIKTLPCLHIYHNTCIDEWMHVSRTCPVCKTSIV